MKIDIKKVQLGISQAFEKHWLESVYHMTAFKPTSAHRKISKLPTKVAKALEKR